MGEGYHNYHHTFASDYRNGVLWYHFDPVKWLVFTLSKLGLARKLVRYDRHTIRRRLLAEDRKLFLSTLAERPAPELEGSVRETAARIQEKLERMGSLDGEIRELRQSPSPQGLDTARGELRALERSLRQDWKSWKLLGDQLLAS